MTIHSDYFDSKGKLLPVLQFGLDVRAAWKKQDKPRKRGRPRKNERIAKADSRN